jgi:AsmA-like C-terminal region
MYPKQNLTLATENCSRNSSELRRPSAKLLEMNPSKAKKVAGIMVAVALVCALALLTAAYSRKRAAELRTRDWIVQLLEERFRSDVDLRDFHVNVFPRMGVSGEGLSLRYRNRPEAPPLIHVEKFSFRLGFWGIFRAPHRIERIHLQRMVITVPPKEQRVAAPEPGAKDRKIPEVSVAEIECDDTELVMLSNNPGKKPLDWEIHNLVLREVKPDKPFPFHGTLTNAKPKGEIETIGQFGPWNTDDPGATPVSGIYGFADANLGPFPGIAGILSSTGRYKGELDELSVDGETDTPDFSLDNVGKPVPLHTDYSATVDGTSGDTLLHPVHAILGESVIVAAGSVVKVPDANGHQITLDVTTPKARIEDILRLAINSDKPFLRGPVDIKAKLSLPPGQRRVIDKMALEGSFAVTNGRWSSSEVRQTLESFSRHAQGQPEDGDAGSAITGLKGSFVLKDSVIHFSKLTFSVPGAGVELAGTYELRSQKIDLRGHLRMQAKLSQTVTGAKSFFLKAIDPFFSKNGAGTELPITITGTQESPVLGVSVFHKKFERSMGKPVY